MAFCLRLSGYLAGGRVVQTLGWQNRLVEMLRNRLVEDATKGRSTEHVLADAAMLD
jgi:hypothetical protein